MAPHTRLKTCHRTKHTGACSSASLYFKLLLTKCTSMTVHDIMATGITHIQAGPPYGFCLVCGDDPGSIWGRIGRQRSAVTYSKADVGAASMMDVVPDMAGRTTNAINCGVPSGTACPLGTWHAMVIPTTPIPRLVHTAWFKMLKQQKKKNTPKITHLGLVRRYLPCHVAH